MLTLGTNPAKHLGFGKSGGATNGNAAAIQERITMRNASLKFFSVLTLILGLAFVLPQRVAGQEQGDDNDDPPSRVARLSQVSGSVSFNPAGTDDWVDAVLNRPMTTGDKLWADNNSRAELHLGSASLRIAPSTGFSFLNLTDDTTQIEVTEGTLRIRVKRLENNETFEIDTPNLAFSILRPGVYKINVNQGGDVTLVEVRDGQGEVTGGGSAYTVHAGEIGTFSGTDQLSADVDRGYDDDDFEQWCADRDRHEDRSVSARYVSDDVIGYDDLDDNGGWRDVPDYGHVWFPHVTVVGWAPYRYGHWVWISPWGWTWVDDEPWGFAPFHYGRWVAVGGVWGWIPAPRPVVGVAYVRPVYAPALVAWVGGPHFSVGVGVGAGPVGWFPLGPREVFVPSYRVSERYVTRVNVTNTTVTNVVVHNYYNNVIVNKNVTVTNVTYVNRRAVTATSGTVFTSAQPVGRNIVRVDQREVERATVVATTPTVAPQQRSVLGAGAAARVRPPAAVVQRTVVAKTAPPPARPSFNRQSEMIRANGGRPISVKEERQVAAQSSQETRPAVRVAPPARPGVPQQQQTRPAVSANPNANQPQPGRGNQPNQNPNQRNPRSYSDRPASSRPANTPPANPQLDQRQQQQQEDLRKRQDQERQRVEQQQVQQQQKLEQQRANEQRQQQTQQRQQQQLENLERKHDQEQQKLQQRQQQERSRQESKPPKQEKQDKQDKDKSKDRPHR
jgi:hypothetical protein